MMFFLKTFFFRVFFSNNNNNEKHKTLQKKPKWERKEKLLFKTPTTSFLSHRRHFWNDLLCWLSDDDDEKCIIIMMRIARKSSGRWGNRWNVACAYAWWNRPPARDGTPATTTFSMPSLSLSRVVLFENFEMSLAMSLCYYILFGTVPKNVFGNLDSINTKNNNAITPWWQQRALFL